MKNYSAIVLVMLLAGCAANPTAVPFLDSVLTVDQFSQVPAMRKRVLVYCSNNPGQTMLDPNCINAVQSARMTSAGNGNFPRISSALPPNF